MPHSYSAVYIHIVFATKGREPLLIRALHDELGKYIRPILQEHGCHLIREGGMPDHVHILLDLGREVSIATILREIKAKTSRWLKQKTGKEFGWQEGYGVFSVSPSNRGRVEHYIGRQEEHHRAETFDEELNNILRAAGVRIEI